MFTMKLYEETKLRIVSADSFTIYQYSPSSYQITAHRKSGDDKAYYVGDGSGTQVGYPSDIWHDKAIIENAAGKTTEIVSPVFPPPVAAQSNLRGAGCAGLAA